MWESVLGTLISAKFVCWLFIESARKRFNSFMEKTRHLVLEEGKVFKKAHDSKSTGGNTTDHDSAHDLNEPTSSTPADLASGSLESSLGKTEVSLPETVKSNVSKPLNCTGAIVVKRVFLIADYREQVAPSFWQR